MITYKEKKYKSLRKLCLELNRDYKKVHARIKSGKNLDIALSIKDLKKTGQSKKVKMKNGKKFSSRTEFANYYKKSPKTISDRLNRGFSPEQAVELEDYEIKNRIITMVDGKKFRSRRKAAQHIGIAPELVGTRLKKGYSLEIALSKNHIKKKNGKEIKIKFDEYDFESLVDACNFFNISYQAARHRVKKDWTFRQVFNLDKPPLNTSKSAPKVLKYKGNTFQSITEFAKKFGIDARVVRQRLSKGYSLSQAIGHTKIDYHSRPQTIIIKGQKFQSRNEAARFFGVNVGTVSTRIKKGWSLEQAFEIEPRPVGAKLSFGTIYKIQNKNNGKLYIGATRQNTFKRYEQHINKKSKILKGGIQEALSKDNVRNFKFSIIATAKSKGELEQLERKFIKKYNTLYPYGYNLSSGGALNPLPGLIIKLKSGKTFSSLSEACRVHNINYEKAKYRFDKGYPIDQVLEIEPIKFNNHPHTSRKINVKGKKFKSLREAAIFYNQPENRVRNRIHRGWNINEALFLEKGKKIKK